MRVRLALAGLLALCASTAQARPPGEVERYFMGRYAVSTIEQKATPCRVQVTWANDVGGEVTTARCAAYPDLVEGLRWWVSAESGDAVVEDALHKQRYRIAETDAGFIAILSDDTHLWLEAVKMPRRARH